MGATYIRGRDPRPYLQGTAPGLWASNHLEEATQCKGWQFVAVRTLAKLSAQAELSIEEVIGKPSVMEKKLRPVRKALKALDRLHKGLQPESAKVKAKIKRKSKKHTKSTVSPTSRPRGRKPAGENDPLLRLLQKPNGNQNKNTFLFQIIQQLSLTGTAFVWTVRDEFGVPKELYVVPTGLCQPRLPSAAFPNGSYWITPLSAWANMPSSVSQWAPGALGNALLMGAEIDFDDVKAIRWPHPVYLSDGLSPLAAGALWVDMSTQMDEAAWYSFENTATPGMIFTQDPTIDPSPEDKETFRQDLRAEYSGTPNTGNNLVLPKGIDAERRTPSPLEMDYVGSRPQMRDMGMALHQVTPIAAGISEASSFAALWAALRQTSELAIQPMLDLTGEELTSLLGEAFPGARRVITFTARAIDDAQTLEQRLRTDIQAKNVLTVKEYRALRKLPPFGDERDDAFVGQDTAKQADEQAKQQQLAAQQQQAQQGKTEDDGQTDTEKPDEDGPKIRSPFRDAVPGRQDRNGKGHNRLNLNGKH